MDKENRERLLRRHYNLAFYYGRKEKHLCPRCGLSVEGSHVYCEICREKKRGRAPRLPLSEREDINRHKREIYSMRKSKGICVRCGKKKAISGETKCPECAERIRRRGYASNMKRYHFLKEHGICVACGQNPAMQGKVFCWECRIFKNQMRSGAKKYER